MRGPIYLLLFACIIAASPIAAQAQNIEGTAEVVDGDTLSMAGSRIRILGIDAPEAAQTCRRGADSWACGREAKERLGALVSGKKVQCQGRDTDTYNRMVAVCRAGGLDLGRTMVETGTAVALPDFSDDYVEAEARAKRLKIGLWGTIFETPSAYRAANQRELAQHGRISPGSQRRPRVEQPRIFRNPMGCAIKGNRNRRGEWIYHLPGMPYYERTRAEDIFCTEAQAQAAGYRRAIVRP